MKRLRGFFTGIRFRLMAWFIIILALVLFIFSAFVYTRQAQDLQDVTLNSLVIKTRQLETLFQFEGLQSIEDVRQLLPSLVSGGISIIQEDEVLIVADSASQWTAQLGPVNQTDINHMVTTTEKIVTSDQPQAYDFTILNTSANLSEQYLFLITPVEAHGSIVGYMLLGRPADPGGQLPRLIATLALASLAVLLGAAGGGYWLAGRILRPVKVITRTAREISDTDLSRRFNLSSSDELGELANTFDDMLARLEAAFERQRQFTADASHELRTPLTIIGLETGRVLGAARSSEEYEQVLQTIQGENDHMTRLVNDLLVLARMESGQTQLHQDQLDLSDVALEVLERLAPLAVDKGIRLEAGELPETRIKGDQAYLVQMVTNLVSNAIKYAPAQNGLVKVETGMRGDKAWVRVEDNGPGIDPQDMPHLFERFYRADKSRARSNGKNDPGGSGLGLAIVRWIARAHGGDASVQSSPGQGSIFEVCLPISQSTT